MKKTNVPFIAVHAQYSTNLRQLTDAEAQNAANELIAAGFNLSSPFLNDDLLEMADILEVATTDARVKDFWIASPALIASNIRAQALDTRLYRFCGVSAEYVYLGLHQSALVTELFKRYSLAEPSIEVHVVPVISANCSVVDMPALQLLTTANGEAA